MMRSARVAAILAGVAVAAFLTISAARYSASLRLFLPFDFPEVPHAGTTHRSDVDFPAKRWVHRVNSIERARHLQRRYSGFEIDVHFDSSRGCFDVGHDAAESIGLCLDGLLASLDDPAARHYWLDFKNLDSANSRAALESLAATRERYALRGRVVVESQSPELLDPFTAAGFFTSYYIPEFDPRTMDAAAIDSAVREIGARLSGARVNAISGYHYQYPVMSRYFPDSDYLLWDLTRGRRDIFAMLYRRRLLADPRVRVVLVREAAPGYR